MKYELPISSLTLAEFKALRRQKETDCSKKKSRHKKRGSMSDVEQLVANAKKEQQQMTGRISPPPTADSENGSEEDGHAPASTDSGRDTGIGHNTITDQELPTLDDVFRLVPPSLGFDIEIKYPHNHEKDEIYPALPDRNAVVDAVLDVVFRYAHVDRQIFFSSFDPATCQMLALKRAYWAPIRGITCADDAQSLATRFSSSPRVAMSPAPATRDVTLFTKQCALRRRPTSWALSVTPNR